MEVDNCIESNSVKADEQINVDDKKKDVKSVEHFKKPTFIGKGPTKKSTFHKIVQQNKVNEETTSTKLQNEPVNLCDKTDEVQEKNGNHSAVSKTQSIPIPYTEPDWKGIAETKYTLEELKSGVIERTIDLQEKSYFCFGRVDTCDICMAHPTVSRFHAILQYRGTKDDENDKGFYLYDLNSTHGTFLNKYRIKPKVYARIKVGHMIKIGCSSRFFILQGPAEDEEEESPLSLTDLKAQRQAEIEERKRKEEEERLLEAQEKEKQERLLEERGISWGMGEDADEETDLSENPYAQVTNEELYIDDPKKALRNWFEREGEELEFETEKADKGLFVSKVVLPIDDGDGREIIIEMTGRSKRESVVQCSLEACRTIDKMGLLRPAKREAKKQQKRNWEENDYYDSDEDSFLDRTGDLDKKREKRMRKAGKIQDSVETYDSLMEKHKVVLEKLESAEKKLNLLLVDDAKEIADVPAEEDVDELDAYMMTLKHKKPKKIDIKIAKEDLNKLQIEETNLRKLINIAKPANIPELILKKTTSPEVVEPCNKEEINIKQVESKKKEIVKRTDENISIEESSSNSKKSKVMGPTLPPGINLNKEVKPKINEKSKKKIENEAKKSSTVDDDDVYSNCVWIPPSGQTGDGRTALNDKYGY